MSSGMPIDVADPDAITIAPNHTAYALLIALFDAALGEQAEAFHHVESWLDCGVPPDPEGWRRLRFGPYSVQFPVDERVATALRTSEASATLPTVHDLLGKAGHGVAALGEALQCDLDWMEEYNSWMLFRTVVEAVTEPRRQIAVDVARTFDPSYEPDDEMADFIAEPGQMWSVVLRESYILAELGFEATDEGDTQTPEITEAELDRMLALPAVDDVGRLVEEVRRLRRSTR